MKNIFSRILSDRDTLTFLVVDVVVAAIIALISWLVNKDPATALLWAMGGTGFLWIMTIRVQMGLQRHDAEQQAERLEHAIESAVNLRLGAFRNRELSKDLRSIVEGARAAEFVIDEPFKTFAKSLIHDFAVKMTLLEKREITVTSDVAWHWALHFIGRSDRIFATTFSSRHMFWSSQSGRQYMAANRTAAQRGANIVRVFILDGVNDEYLIEGVVKEHIEADIDAWIVSADNIDQSKLIDLAAFDESIISIWQSPRPESELEQVTWSRSPEALAGYKSVRDYYSYRAIKLSSLRELNSWVASLPRSRREIPAPRTED